MSSPKNALVVKVPERTVGLIRNLSPEEEAIIYRMFESEPRYEKFIDRDITFFLTPEEEETLYEIHGYPDLPLLLYEKHSTAFLGRWRMEQMTQSDVPVHMICCVTKPTRM